MKTFTVQIIALLLLQVTDVTAFISQCPKPTAAVTAKTITKTASAFRTFAEPTDSSDWEEVEEPDRPKLDSFLEKRYPSFYKLINDDMMLAIKQGGVTIFVPNEKAFKKLGKQKRSQIEDPRNLEIREKMGSYHIIEEESISAVQLAIEDWSRGKPKDGSRPNTMISGINTLSGKVPVGRSKSGGFLGWGAKEDGDIVIGPDAKILQSFNVEGSFVHEVNDLVSPLLLWRYCDQLRIL